MSLDIYLKNTVHEQNITHNMTAMAEEAGIYDCLWRPKENDYWNAKDLIEPLARAIEDMKERPEHYKKFNPENGWGSYDDFVPWLEELLRACRTFPDAEVAVWV